MARELSAVWGLTVALVILFLMTGPLDGWSVIATAFGWTCWTVLVTMLAARRVGHRRPPT